MFSTRRSSFAEPSRQSGPFGVMLGLSAAAIIIFVVGVFVGRSMPRTMAAPFTVGEPVAPFDAGVAEVPAAPDVSFDATPDATSADVPEVSSEPAPDEALSNSPLPESTAPASEPVTATEH
tara:strand:- start:3706 stop:4068 length:363 start_codon:yes stop_codon:yes gene_type:complete